MSEARNYISSELQNEKELVLRMAKGDANAFTAIYSHYLPEINRFILGYLKIPELVSDLTQEIFLKIWNERGRMAELDSFKAYLLITTRNRTIDILRRAGIHDRVIGAIGKKHLQDRVSGTDEILTREYQAFLKKAIDSLPPKGREVFKLCREEGKSYDEVAELLGISPSTVKHHMIHSIKVLKAAVEKDLGISFSLFLLIITGK